MGCYIDFLKSGGETEFAGLFTDAWNDIVRESKDPPEITAAVRQKIVREFLHSNSCLLHAYI